MKRTPLLLLLSLLMTWSHPAVAQPASETASSITSSMSFPRGEVIPEVTALGDPNQQYSLFLPADYNLEETWPVLLVMDPRGRAEASLELFLDGARRHGWIVISSYQTRSDTNSAITTDAFMALIQEIAARGFSVHLQRLYLTGMSGTGFIAWHLAKTLPSAVAGVIGVGAGLPRDLEDPGQSIPFDYYGIAGTADFNFQEQRRLDHALGEIGANHHFEVWEGSHGWPPTADFTIAAVDWMELMAMKRSLTPRREDFIAAQYNAAFGRAKNAPDPLSRLRAWKQLVADFEGLKETAEARQSLAVVEKTDEVKQALRQQKKFERQENNYLAQLHRWIAITRQSPQPLDQQQSMITLQIPRLQKQAQDLSDPYAAQSAQRRLEAIWVRTSFYLPNEFEESNRLEHALDCLEISVMIFPERFRGHLGKAEILTRMGRKDRAFQAFEQALDNGWSASEQFLSNPAWDPLRKDPRWQQLLSEVPSSDKTPPS